jgi:hypothetical protein
MVTDVRPVHPTNALAPILVIPDKIAADINDVLFAKVAGIDVNIVLEYKKLVFTTVYSLVVGAVPEN